MCKNDFEIRSYLEYWKCLCLFIFDKTETKWANLFTKLLYIIIINSISELQCSLFDRKHYELKVDFFKGWYKFSSSSWSIKYELLRLYQTLLSKYSTTNYYTYVRTNIDSHPPKYRITPWFVFQSKSSFSDGEKTGWVCWNKHSWSRYMKGNK